MSDLKTNFISFAQEYLSAIEIGHHKKANRYHDKLMELYHSMKDNNSWEILYELLKDEDNSVKLWAATFLLKNNEELALQVLNQLCSLEGAIKPTASTTIAIWKSGMSKL